MRQLTAAISIEFAHVIGDDCLCGQYAATEKSLLVQY